MIRDSLMVSKQIVAGSKYTQTGMFEVTKAEEEEKPSTSSPPASPNPNASTTSTQSHSGSNSKSSALRVTIPSELQGVAYIEVLCQKGMKILFSSISQCNDSCVEKNLLTSEKN